MSDNIPGPAFFLIHAAGKDGSQSMEAAIRASMSETQRVERHHYLSGQGLRRLVDASRLPGIEPSELCGFQQQIDSAQLAAREVREWNDESVWVITGVRDPLAVSMAAFFQNLPIYCPWVDYSPESLRKSVSGLMEFFSDQFDRMLSKHPPASFPEALLDIKLSGPALWFEEEFSDFHSIDPYTVELGSESFVSFSHNNRNFLIYRTDHLSAARDSILIHMGLAPPSVTTDRNIGEAKEYGGLYRAFCAEFRPPSHMTDYYYGSRYWAHFCDN